MLLMTYLVGVSCLLGVHFNRYPLQLNPKTRIWAKKKGLGFGLKHFYL